MKVLALDTATPVAAVGVVSDHASEGAIEMDVPAKNHAPTLIATIDEVLRRAGIRLDEIDGLAVGVGPGSFTGVRIGVATAKGLALATGKPLWGVSTLEAMARGGGDGLVVTVIPSRAGEVIAAAYERGEVVLAPCLMAVGAIDSWITAEGRSATVVGATAGAVRVGPRAHDVAAIAFSLAAVRSAGDGDALAPVYLAAPPVRRAM